MPSEAEWARFEARIEAHFKEQREMDERLHRRLDEHLKEDNIRAEEHTEKLGEIREAFAQHVMAPCPDAKLLMAEHKKESHNFAKFVGILTGIAAFAVAFFEGLAWLVKAMIHGFKE